MPYIPTTHLPVHVHNATTTTAPTTLGMPRTESMESFLSVTSADDDDGTGSAAGEGGCVVVDV